MFSLKKIIVALSASLLFAALCTAQTKKRLQPGKIYEPGEKIYAPKYGFNGVVPEGWDGTLPRETEIFLLMPRTGIGGEVFTFVSEGNDLQSIREAWLRGTNMSESILIKAKDVVTTGDMITSEGRER
jgi:hypothetical protein